MTIVIRIRVFVLEILQIESTQDYINKTRLRVDEVHEAAAITILKVKAAIRNADSIAQ